MAIEVNGEKYACEACVRGHRVSNCTHKDRELKHINKKGRPVSQCPHCRGMRKARSAHVKCICADLANGSASVAPSASPLHTPHSPTGPMCQCMHGEQCNCCVKKEHSDVSDVARAAAMNATHKRSISHGKPVMSYRRSDSTLPHARHSFHPPLHRMNHAAHEYGLPYPLKRASASHGNLGMSTMQRSVDNLPLSSHTSAAQSLPSYGAMTPDFNLDFTFAGGMQANSAGSLTQFGGNGLAVATSNDKSFFARSMSPANPQRYSMSDLTQLGWNGSFNTAGEFGQSVPAYSTPASATDSLPLSWSELDLANSYNYNTMAQQNPQPPSVDSVDQPSLSRSSSGTASDTAESSNLNLDFTFNAMSQTPLDAGAWSSSYQEADPFSFEEAFNQQKTPKATNPEGSVGVFDDYFGNIGEAGAPAPQAEASLARSSPGQSTGWSGMMMPADTSDGWNSQVDLSVTSEGVEIKQEHSAMVDQFSWN